MSNQFWLAINNPVCCQFKLPEHDYERLISADSEEVQRNVLEGFSKNLPNTNRTVNGSIRWCEKCRHIKPDRAHHCSVCGECILKMDHHCPWVNNCVCFTNYKFFILFLGYSLIYCIYISLTSLQYFIAFWKVFVNTCILSWSKFLNCREVLKEWEGFIFSFSSLLLLCLLLAQCPCFVITFTQ